MTVLLSEVPWAAEYVPWQDRPRWVRGLGVERRGPFAGESAFWVDSELGGRGVQVVWVDGEMAGVQLNVPYSGLDYDPYERDGYRRAQEKVRVVRVADLRESMELANLAAWGRGIVRYAASPEGYSYASRPWSRELNG